MENAKVTIYRTKPCDKCMGCGLSVYYRSHPNADDRTVRCTRRGTHCPQCGGSGVTLLDDSMIPSVADGTIPSWGLAKLVTK